MSGIPLEIQIPRKLRSEHLAKRLLDTPGRNPLNGLSRSLSLIFDSLRSSPSFAGPAFSRHFLAACPGGGFGEQRQLAPHRFGGV